MAKSDLSHCPVLVNLRVSCSPYYNGISMAKQSRYIQLSAKVRSEAKPEEVNKKADAATNAVKSSSKAEKPSSKVEETVNRLKQKKEEKENEQKLEIKVTSSDFDSLQESETQKKEVEVKKKTLWVRFVDEVKHYYSGFKLLFLDVKICSKIVFKLTRGGTLTRRENKQLVRTVSDLFRLVPFSVFVIVPFMEVLLPVALKLFPGMLPSTFTTSSERENKMRRTLQAKLQYAKFLQKTLDEMALDSNVRSSQSARDFVNFYKEVKEKGIAVDNKDIIKFSKLFEDEITLDNMERQQLKALCRLLELTPVGHNNFLRFQLELKLRQLRIDDKVIQKEGLENLDVHELQAACKERGMRAYGMSEKMLRFQLMQWLDLSLNANIPSSLLLLSRTLYLPENLEPTAQIAATISTLPESTATVATAQIGEREGKIRNVERLELIKEEQRKIEEEEKETKAEEEKLKEVEAVAAAEEIKEKIVEKAKKIEEMVEVVEQKVPEAAAVTVEKLIQDSGIISAVAKKDEDLAKKEETEGDEETEEAELEVEITTQDLTDLQTAIEHLGKVDTAEEEIIELKKELQDYEEDLVELKFIKAEAGRFDLKESKGAKRLFTKVNKMLGKVDHLVTNLEKEKEIIAEKINMADQSKEEIVQEQEKLVTIHELIDAVQRMQKTPDSSKVEKISEVIKLIKIHLFLIDKT